MSRWIQFEKGSLLDLDRVSLMRLEANGRWVLHGDWPLFVPLTDEQAAEIRPLLLNGATPTLIASPSLPMEKPT